MILCPKFVPVALTKHKFFTIAITIGTRLVTRVGRGQYKLFIVDDPVKILFEGPGEARLANLGSKSNPSLHKLQKIDFSAILS